MKNIKKLAQMVGVLGTLAVTGTAQAGWFFGDVKVSRIEMYGTTSTTVGGADDKFIVGFTGSYCDTTPYHFKKSDNYLQYDLMFRTLMTAYLSGKKVTVIDTNASCANPGPIYIKIKD